MRGWFAVFIREMLILRRKLKRQLASMSVSPVLYLIAFGFGIGGGVSVGGRPYLDFLLPGLAAMSGMIHAFSIGSEINIARFYWRIFEEIQASPVSEAAYVTGEVLAGITRALIATAIIIVIGLVSGTCLNYGPLFWMMVLLNAFLFSSLAVGLAMMVRSHADQALLTSFIITPMAFLGGTFFPTEQMPVWIQGALSLLPLTHASLAIRAAALDSPFPLYSCALLALLGGIVFAGAVRAVRKARD